MLKYYLYNIRMILFTEAYKLYIIACLCIIEVNSRYIKYNFWLI
jgi:hypothetical protein